MRVHKELWLSGGDEVLVKYNNVTISHVHCLFPPTYNTDSQST